MRKNFFYGKEAPERLVLLLPGLADKNGEVDVVEWKEAFGQTYRSTFRRLSNRVVEGGYVERSSLKRVRITPEGRKLITALEEQKRLRLQARLEAARQSASGDPLLKSLV